MNLETLLAVWAVSLCLSLAVVAVTTRPLRLILTDLCGTAERARFWTLYAALLVIIAPLLMVSTPGMLEGAVVGGLGVLLQRAVFRSLIGIVIALAAMGYAVSRPIVRISPPNRGNAP